MTQSLSEDGKTLTLTADGESATRLPRAGSTRWSSTSTIRIILDPDDLSGRDDPEGRAPARTSSRGTGGCRSARRRWPATPAGGVARSPLLKFPVDIPQGTKIDSAQLAGLVGPVPHDRGPTQ